MLKRQRNDAAAETSKIKILNTAPPFKKYKKQRPKLQPLILPNRNTKTNVGQEIKYIYQRV